MKKVLLTTTLLHSLTMYAAEDTATLPKGRFRARIVGIQTGTIEQKFNNDGKVQLLTHDLNRSVTVKDLVAKQPELASLVGALNTLQPGLGNQLAGSELTAKSELSVRQYVPALEYGITDNITYGVKVFLVNRDSRNAFNASETNNAQSIKQQFGSSLSPQIIAGLDKLSGAALNTAGLQNSLFTSKGYEAPSDFQKSELGDIDTGVKYRFYKEGMYAAATQWGVRIPTGSAPSLTNIYDKGSGGAAFGLSGSFFQDLAANNWLTFGSMLKGWYFAPDTRLRAVPMNANDSLPSLLASDGQVQNTTRIQGLQLDTELSATGEFFEQKLSTYVAYQYSVHGNDRYTGPGNLYYEGLSQFSDWNRGALEIGASVYTVPWFRAKQFPVPGRLSILYNTVLTGKNTPVSDYARMDLAVFF